MPTIKKQPITETEFYWDKVLDNVALQCERRGIPEKEVKTVLTRLAEKHGSLIEDMELGDLRRVARDIPLFLEGEYLGDPDSGVTIKRRPLPGYRVPAGFAEAGGVVET